MYRIMPLNSNSVRSSAEIHLNIRSRKYLNIRIDVKFGVEEYTIVRSCMTNLALIDKGVGTGTTKFENLVKYRGIAVVLRLANKDEYKMIKTKFDEKKYIAHQTLVLIGAGGGYRSSQILNFGQICVSWRFFSLRVLPYPLIPVSYTHLTLPTILRV